MAYVFHRLPQYRIIHEFKEILLKIIRSLCSKFEYSTQRIFLPNFFTKQNSKMNFDFFIRLFSDFHDEEHIIPCPEGLE